MISRHRILASVFFLAFLALTIKLFFWQVYKGKDLSVEARSQYQKSKTVFAPRGNIFASDGSYLAAREGAWLVFAYLPETSEDVGKIADKLAPIFTEEEENSDLEEEILNEANRLKSVLTKSGASWLPLKHRVDLNTKTRVEALKINGVGFELEESRSYPEASSAAHILGFVGKSENGDDQGYFGLEGYYDLTLSGKQGYVSRESDAKGVPILLGGSQEVLAIEGVDLVTYIDKTVQLTVEKVLLDGIEKYGAKAGTVIVLDPKTAGVMAMASYPNYDPSFYTDYGNELFKNPAVSNSFEPGSIFKVLIMASALDAKIVKPDTECEVCDGPLKVGKYSIETWNNKYRPDSTMLDVIVNSDNVGMAWVAQKLGSDTLYGYLRNFGIGSLTGVDLQGEASPKLRDKDKWSLIDLSTIGFGQGIAATPMQIITAVNAIANEGVMLSPRVVKKIQGDGWEAGIDNKQSKKVISKNTAEQVKAMMVEAAKNGESKWTHLRGFRVAGKTGTAQIPVEGYYDEERTIASFIGFAPSDDPEFIMLVTLQEPTSSPWASETAAPLWYTIAKDLFLYFGIQPES